VRLSKSIFVSPATIEGTNKIEHIALNIILYFFFSLVTLIIATSWLNSVEKPLAIAEERPPQPQTVESRGKQLDFYLEEQRMSTELELTLCFKQEACEYLKNAIEKQSLKRFNETSATLYAVMGLNSPDAVDSLRRAIEVDPNFHAAYVLYGVSLIKMDRIDEAETYFRKAINLKPKFLLQYMLLSSAYEKQENLKGALAILLEGKTKCRPTASLYEQIGDTYLKLSNYEAAIAAYKEIDESQTHLSKNSLISRAYLLKGDLAASWENLKKIDHLTYYDSELKEYLQPYFAEEIIDSYEAMASRARIYYLNSNYEKAKALYLQILKKYPNRFDQYFELGEIHYFDNELSSAFNHFLRAADQEEGHFGAYLYLGRIISYEPTDEEKNDPEKNIKTDFDRAIWFYERAMNINKDSYLPYLHIGSIHLKQNNLTDALHFVDLAESKAKTYTVFFLKADIYQKMGDLEKEIAYRRKAIELNDHPSNRSRLAIALYSAGLYRDLESFLVASIEKYPDVSHLQELLADAYKKQGKNELAAEKYLRILSKDDSAHVNSKLAACYFNMKDFDNAALYYNRAYEKNAKPEYAYGAGISYFKLKKWERAIYYFEQIRKSDPKDVDVNRLLSKARYNIEGAKYTGKLRRLSSGKGENALYAKALMAVREYVQANNLLIQGIKETELEYGDRNIPIGYKVSSKIYEAQGLLESLIKKLESVEASRSLAMAVEDLKTACSQRASGIEEMAKGYYLKKVDYHGEFEKGRAKIDLADKIFLTALQDLKKLLFSRKSTFGEFAIIDLQDVIDYYEKKLKH
jgi:tetratricopeptide (TPR) repeat protein